MPLQDIKYVMSVDDRQAQQAIRKTAEQLKSLDRSERAPGRGETAATNLVEMINSAGSAAASAFTELGEALASAFSGNLMAGAVEASAGLVIEQLTGLIDDAVTGAVEQAGGAALEKGTGKLSGVFAGAGAALGFTFSQGFATRAASEFAGAGTSAARLFAEAFRGLGRSIAGSDIAQNVAEMFRDGFARINSTALVSTLRRGMASSIAGFTVMGGEIAERVHAGFAAALARGRAATAPMRKWLAGQIAGAFVGLPVMMGERLKPVADWSGRFGKEVGGRLSAGFAAAWGGVTAISWKAVAGMTAAVGVGVAAIGASFMGIANHASAAWAEVKDGIMTVQASLVGFGKSVEDAFSSDVEGAILDTANRMAVAFGTMPSEISAATAVLTKNGMELNAALSRMGLVANIAKVNAISHVDAAKKLVEAWNGEARALKEIGIRIDSTGDKAKDAELLMRKLQERYGNLELSKRFIDDDPFARATAAVRTLWVQLGKALDPAISAAAQALSDAILGIAEGLKDAGSADFIPNFMGLLAGIGEVTTVVINAAVIAGNIGSMLVTGLTSFGQSLWYGIQWVWAWLEDKMAVLLEFLGEAISYIPGTGEAGTNIQIAAAEMQKASQKIMAESGKGFVDAAKENAQALAKDWEDIQRAVAPDGGVVGDLQRKGRSARERAQKEAMEQAQNAPALPEAESVREDRENREREEAEKRAREARRIMQQNERIERERARFGRSQERLTVVLQTPQRMVPALRNGRRR